MKATKPIREKSFERNSDTAEGPPSFRRLLTRELQSAVWIRFSVTLGILSLAGLLLTFWLPTIPDGIYRRFNETHHLKGLSEFLLANQYAYLFIVLYWAGISEALRIRIDLLKGRLVTPLSFRVSNDAKIASLSLVTITTGALGAIFNWFVLTTRGFSIDPMRFIGAIAVIVAFSVFLIAIVNVLVLRIAEIYAALLVAAVPGFLSILPGILFVYRPDVLAARPGLRNLVVFPINLIWYGDVIARWGVVIATIILFLAVGFMILAGWLLERNKRTKHRTDLYAP